MHTLQSTHRHAYVRLLSNASCPSNNRYAGLSDLDSLDWPDKPTQSRLPEGLPLRFTQRAGDLVIVPAQWGHSTLSDGGSGYTGEPPTVTVTPPDAAQASGSGGGSSC